MSPGVIHMNFKKGNCWLQTPDQNLNDTPGNLSIALACEAIALNAHKTFSSSRQQLERHPKHQCQLHAPERCTYKHRHRPAPRQMGQRLTDTCIQHPGGQGG